eukprot:Blabericola_migrator_1__6498@NODE_327_length_9735_cov_125_899772_g264_i0_p7_GENE_NODE_327_length_9735_cov_125_899772_g264_i0NODE_327_length_9735_cov_125_899772_g264_i0_p7_ORF_typecomplete_len143_score9_18Sec7_N/PF12783_7/0_11_NODE_327_length_9735_cov_125_899772_g264_i07521180
MLFIANNPSSYKLVKGLFCRDLISQTAGTGTIWSGIASKTPSNEFALFARSWGVFLMILCYQGALKPLELHVFRHYTRQFLLHSLKSIAQNQFSQHPSSLLENSGGTNLLTQNFGQWRTPSMEKLRRLLGAPIMYDFDRVMS